MKKFIKKITHTAKSAVTCVKTAAVNSMSAVLAFNRRAVCSNAGEGYIDTAVKVLIAVVLGAQQGEDERTFLAERPARVDAPAEHEGHPLAAHLDVVVVRDVAADLPYDAPPVGGDLPALSAYGNCGQHENASQ